MDTAETLFACYAEGPLRLIASPVGQNIWPTLLEKSTQVVSVVAAKDALQNTF